ncbi:Long-chain-fatty-acid--CoA ligase ACSBG2 [Acipenser ruthenus]|uniref:long-chain-fatty-acid--CoA ligase n=1 Tax=Acipenser ruthenus TaxID=7906 RepID=A0A444UTC4_ACIRT|nr:Long-chain-fatty-acid--CoA ligase ACSBG2 [Acipenser ruthenus]
MSVNSVGVNWDQLEVDQTESFLDISPFVREYIGSPLTTSNPASNTGFFNDVKIPQNGNYSHIVVNGGNSLMQEVKKAGAVLEIQVEPPSNGKVLEPTPVQVPVQVPVPTLAPSEMMWTIKRDEPVKLRITQSGPGSETPVTVHQMFQHAVEQYGETPALAVKKEGQWATLTFREYYNECRLAAKSFLKLPHLKAIVQYKDELQEKQPNLYTWKEFMELGKQIPDAQLDDVIRSQKANQCCSLIYTSGTTGQPKGVMLSHDNLTWTAEAAGKTANLENGTEKCIISYLPLSHIAAQLIDIWISMRFGATTYFAEPDALKGSLVNTMREVRPTAFMAVPRVWEKMQEKMQSQASKSSLVKRKVAEWAKYIGLQANYNFMNGYCTRLFLIDSARPAF